MTTMNLYLTTSREKLRIGLHWQIIINKYDQEIVSLKGPNEEILGGFKEEIICLLKSTRILPV